MAPRKTEDDATAVTDLAARLLAMGLVPSSIRVGDVEVAISAMIGRKNAPREDDDGRDPPPRDHYELAARGGRR